MTSTWSAPARRPAPPGSRGTLLVADRIVTLGHARTHARALLVRGSRVVWIGDDPDQAPPHRERHELPGCVIGPAFVDAHLHLTPTGLGLRGLDLSDARSRAELLEAVATYAQQHPGRVIWGHGLEPDHIVDGLPSPDELSMAAGERTVYLSRVDGHAALVDHDTLGAAPLARADGVGRSDEGPTGVLKREANHIARRWAVGAMDSAELAAARRTAVRTAAQRGLATVHEMASPDIMGLSDLDAWVEGEWPIEVIPYWGGLDLGVVIERDLRQAGGDLLLDGSLGSHTAALEAPYADRPWESGHLELDDETLGAWFREVAHAGLQSAVHAIGDAALRQVVRCWSQVAEALEPEGGVDLVRRGRHRIEHAEVLPPDLLDDVAELGLVISAQPAF
ncbi:MAG: amidohydrolase, partial [Nitriliruptoraceae bacterium]